MKRYIIAGGTSGIGLALTETLVAAGNEVIVMSRCADKSQNNTQHFVVDFSSDDISLPIIDGPIDGIVYTPGSINLKPFQSLHKKDYINDINLNLIGAIELIKKYLANLKQATQPSIVLMSSVAAGTGMPYHTSVAVSKGAIEGLTRSLAAELSPKIRVNAIAPSLTETPLAAKLINTPEKKEAAKERHPLKQIGEAFDLAELIHFLLSDKSKFITGQIIHADGGISNMHKL